MKKYISFIYKYNKAILVLFIILNVVAIFGVSRIQIETTFNVFQTENSKYLDNLNLLFEEFPSSNQMIIMLEKENHNIEDVKKFEDYLNEMNEIKYIRGITNSSLDLPINVELDQLSPIKVVNGKEYVVLTVFPDETFDFSNLKSIEKYLEDNNFKYYLSGDQYMQTKIFDYLLFLLLLIPPFAMIVLFYIFKIQMKSAKATILTVMPAGVAALWTLGIAGLIGSQVSVLTILAPIFTIIIGSADGLHFMSHLQEYLEEGNSIKESLSKTLNMVGVPMIITTITSVIGFIALIFINTAAIYDLAIFAAIGITFAGIITWVVLPLFNSFEKLDVTRKPGKLKININFKKLWGKPSFIIVILIVIVSIISIPHLKTEFNQLMLYKDYTEVSKGFNKIMEVNEGTIPLFALIKYDENLFDSELTENIYKYQDKLEKNDSVSKVFSFYTILDVIKTKLPPNVPMDKIDFNSISLYSEMVSNNYIKIMIFPADLNNDTIKNIITITDKISNIKLAGTQLMMYELNKNMISGQILSMLIAFSLVFLALFFSIKKLLPSIFAMLPI
ncbi:MAG: MMPL family transporter [Clostridiales bacterium]|nr:MMPL family transporter [Clostridiales bacterium]